MSKYKTVLAFAEAVFATTVLGSIMQTQFNLGFLQDLGVPIPLKMRLLTTAHDLWSFAPTFAMVVAIGFLIAFMVAARIIKDRPRLMTLGYILAGGVAIFAALLAMQLIFGSPPLAAARTASGFMSLVACGCIGGFTFTFSLKRGIAPFLSLFSHI